MPVCEASVTLRAKNFLTELRVTGACAPPLAARVRAGGGGDGAGEAHWPSVDAGASVSAAVALSVSGGSGTGGGASGSLPLPLPVSLSGAVLVQYTNMQGAQRGVLRVLSVPLAALVRYSVPQKEAAFKITIETNQPPIDLNSLFKGRTRLAATRHYSSFPFFSHNKYDALVLYFLVSLFL